MSEIAIIGRGALAAAFLAIVVTGISATIAALGGRTRYRVAAEYGAYLVSTLFGVAATAMIHAFIHHDYRLTYVYQYSDASMPWVYQLAAFWGGQAGSLMFWAGVLSILMALVTLVHRKRDAALMPWVIAVMCSVLAFFTVLMLFVSDPFETFSIIDPPGDGRGLNPQLQTFTMVVHPPSLLTGYVSATVPFAFAMAALLSGRVQDDAWLKATRKWTLICWGFLTIGLVLGMLWAYTELGWGGYWAWDPVENAAFIPWLVMTAFLHSAVIQEKRGMLKRWNMFLVLLGWLLTIFGTFLTRSGLIASVHSFAQSDIGDYFLIYLLAMIAVCIGVVAWRWGALRSDNDIESPLSREFAFLFNNWLLLIAAGVVLFGTLFPKLKEMFTGDTAILGEPWFNKMMAPIGIALLGLTAVGVVISWRKASRRNFQRNFVKPLIFAGVMTFVVPAVYYAVRMRNLIGDHGLPLDTEMVVRSGLAAADVLALLVVGVLGLVSLFRVFKTNANADWFKTGAFAFTGLGLIFVLWRTLDIDHEVPGAAEIVREMAYAMLALFFCAFVVGTVWAEFWKGTRVRMSKLGVGPLTALAGLLVRNPRRYGGYVVHLGIAALMFGFIGQAFTIEQKVTMEQGEVVRLGDYDVILIDAWREHDPEKDKVLAHIELRDADTGALVSELLPGRFFFHASQAATSEVDIRSTPFEDVYFAVLNHELAGDPGVTRDKDIIALTMVINPFVWWVWIGGILMVLGTLVCMWPVDLEDTPRADRRRRDTGSSKAKRATVVGLVSLLAWPLMILAVEGVAHADETHADDALGGASLAEQTRETFDPAVRSIFSKVMCECPNCAGQTIAQCKPTCGHGARDRARIAELHERGYDETEILASFRQERGDAAVVAAPTEGFNNLSWMLPAAGGLVSAPLIAFAFARRRRRRDDDDAPLPDETVPAPEDDAELAAATDADLDDPIDDDDDLERLDALERALERLD